LALVSCHVRDDVAKTLLKKCLKRIIGKNKKYNHVL